MTENIWHAPAIAAEHLCRALEEAVRAAKSDREARDNFEWPAQRGRKDDGDKPRTDLLPPMALLEVAKVLGYGAERYGAGNWMHVEDAPRRYIAAAIRHILAHMSGEGLDPESCRPHLAHAAASLLFVLELEQKGKQS